MEPLGFVFYSPMIKPQTKTEIGRSRESMLALWIGKQLKPDIEERAKVETERTGIRINGNALAKEIFLWAYDLYRDAGSLAELKRMRPPVASNRISSETHEELYAALRIILQRAPSTVIEDIIRRLVKAAGQYGEEK